jgi:hypothetical protein
VLEVEGRIVWMKGAELEPEQGLVVTANDEPGGGRSGEKDGVGGEEEQNSS